MIKNKLKVNVAMVNFALPQRKVDGKIVHGL